MLMILFSAPAAALRPTLRVGQYGHTAWRVSDGKFRGYPTSLAQTRDGYLWLGTEFGLVRFDGTRFISWHPPAGQRLPSDSVARLLEGSDGSLWVGTARGLARLQDGALELYPTLSGSVAALLEDRHGTVWAGTRSGLAGTGELCAVRESEVECFGRDGLFGRFVSAVYEDRSGALWVAAATGLWQWGRGAPVQRLPIPSMSVINSIGEDDRGIVVSFNDGIRRLVDGQLTWAAGGPLSLGRLKSTRAMLERNGALWMGTPDAGLIRLQDGRVSRFATEDGLSGVFVTDILEDREGNVWVATLGGLDRFRDLAVVTISSRDGLSTDTVVSVLSASDDSVWIGTVSGLNQWRGGRTTTWLAGESIQSLFEDRQGRLWVASSDRLRVFQDGHFRVVPGAERGFIHAIAQDAGDDVWLADQERGLLRFKLGRLVQEIPTTFFEGRTVRSLAASSSGGLWVGFFEGGVDYVERDAVRIRYRAADGLSRGEVNHLHVDSEGALWAATQGGLSRIVDGRIHSGHVRTGCEATHWVVEDRLGAVWAYTVCGLARLDDDRFLRRRSGNGAEAHLFDATDGVMLTSRLGSYSPKVSLSADGRLWFGTYGGVATIDPSDLSLNLAPPPVHVEEIIADGRTYRGTPSVRLESPVRDLRISFTATSLTMSDKVRFRYRLAGRDSAWVDAGSRREVAYTDLPPNQYRFHVIASNNDGIWNELGAATTIRILPAFYETNIFKVAIAITLIAAIAGIYQLRLHLISNRLRDRFQERLDERTRLAQDLHDTLLQGIASASMQLHVLADELQEHPARARLHRITEGIRSVANDGRRAIADLRYANTSESLEDVILRDGRTLRGDQAVELRVVVEGKPRPLHPLIRDDVYRITREALINAFRHARANHIDVVVEYGKELLAVRVRDNGCGMQKALADDGREGHWGLQGMRERAERIGAKLRLLSRPGAGTEVVLLVPGASAYNTIGVG